MAIIFYSVHCSVLDTSADMSHINVNVTCFQKTCSLYFNAGFAKIFSLFCFLAQKVLSLTLTAGILMILII